MFWGKLEISHNYDSFSVPSLDDIIVCAFFSESTNYTFVDEQAIFANNELGMRHIEVYGFDYDYTLASYSNTLHYLIYDLAVKELISTYGVRTTNYFLK